MKKLPYGSFKYVDGDINTAKEFFMNKKLIFSVLLVVCLLAVVTVVAFAQTSPTVSWEYRLLIPSQGSQQAFNSLGTEGWEFVGLNSTGHNVFKRRLP